MSERYGHFTTDSEREQYAERTYDRLEAWTDEVWDLYTDVYNSDKTLNTRVIGYIWWFALDMISEDDARYLIFETDT